MNLLYLSEIMKKVKQILAIIGVIFLSAMYVFTLIVAWWAVTLNRRNGCWWHLSYVRLSFPYYCGIFHGIPLGKTFQRTS